MKRYKKTKSYIFAVRNSIPFFNIDEHKVKQFPLPTGHLMIVIFLLNCILGVQQLLL